MVSASRLQGCDTEAKKRKLDAIRDLHPATKLDDIPEDVQCYINRGECEIYDHKQQQTVARPAVTSVIGICLLALIYFGFESSLPYWDRIGRSALAVCQFCLEVERRRIPA